MAGVFNSFTHCGSNEAVVPVAVSTGHLVSRVASLVRRPGYEDPSERAQERPIVWQMTLQGREPCLPEGRETAFDPANLLAANEQAPSIRFARDTLSSIRPRHRSIVADFTLSGIRGRCCSSLLIYSNQFSAVFRQLNTIFYHLSDVI